MRLDHLLSRVSRAESYDRLLLYVPFAVKGDGLNGKLVSYHFSVVKVRPWACSSAGEQRLCKAKVTGSNPVISTEFGQQENWAYAH